MMVVSSACKNDGGYSGKLGGGVDAGKYVRYTPEQVDALERLYNECPKPTSLRRQQLIRECPILSNIEPKQIKVWFQNRRCREKQRIEASRLQAVNRKLTAMNKLLMEENDRLQKQVGQLVYENSYFRNQNQNTAGLATTDTSCESVVTVGQQKSTSYRPLRDSSPAGLVSIAEETLAEFLSKATGTAVEWVQMPGMKPGPDSIGIIAISHGCSGVAARACGLVSIEPTRVVEILKDRPSWCHDCRAIDVVNVLPTGNGGTIELLYMQLYALTTLAPARDFWLMRYTSALEDGSIVVCERSLNNTQNGASIPPVNNFVRGEILASGYLIRPCDGGGSIIHVVDHLDLEPWSVPEVIRPLYESSTLLAQRTTMAALRQLRQISLEITQPNVSGWGRRPAALRALGQRLSKGFNEAVNGFMDEGWSVMESDGVDDVTILVNSSPGKILGANCGYDVGFSSLSSGFLSARASMLLQKVPPALLLRFLREHRSEWADSSIDAYAAAAIKAAPSCQAFELEALFMEVVRLENIGYREDMYAPGDIFMLQLCCGMDEKASGRCAELIFAPIDASFSDDAPLLSSGFRIIPIDSFKDVSSPKCTLDLASALEFGSKGYDNSGSSDSSNNSNKSVMTIAFQFSFEPHLLEGVASMARQYVRSIVSSVQRVASALSPCYFTPLSRSPVATAATAAAPEAQTLSRWITQSYRCYFGADLVKPGSGGGTESLLLKSLWLYSDAILCCSLKGQGRPMLFTFANQAGLDMLETTMVGLQDTPVQSVFDERIFAETERVMQQGFVCLGRGLCTSTIGRSVSYDTAVAFKVMMNDAPVIAADPHCICFIFTNWSFL
ncbi:LOW QUALITY PROTEIN: hypothetical protein V2J09_022358 [Rumex salicifolius]